MSNEKEHSTHAPASQITLDDYIDLMQSINKMPNALLNLCISYLLSDGESKIDEVCTICDRLRGEVMSQINQYPSFIPPKTREESGRKIATLCRQKDVKPKLEQATLILFMLHNEMHPQEIIEELKKCKEILKQKEEKREEDEDNTKEATDSLSDIINTF